MSRMLTSPPTYRLMSPPAAAAGAVVAAAAGAVVGAGAGAVVGAAAGFGAVVGAAAGGALVAAGAVPPPAELHAATNASVPNASEPRPARISNCLRVVRVISGWDLPACRPILYQRQDARVIACDHVHADPSEIAHFVN